MASFTERIRLIFDVDSKGATTGFRGFASSVREAEGLTGKMKAGAGSLTATLKDNMGPAALATGAALVTFGVKAVGAFTEGAKAAKDMASATGLSAEEASRWIAVADDMGVSAEALTVGVGKIAKTLDGTQWAKYGIATKDAAGNTRAANDVLLDAFDVLGKIRNETDRAAAGNELFGKGYVNLSPLIGKTRAELEKYLAAVEDGQVYTEKEIQQGEKMRLAMDHLSDALGEVTLATGKMVAGFAPVLDSMASSIELTQEWADKLHILDYGMTGLKAYVNPIAGVQDAMDKAKGSAIAWSDFTRDELIVTIKDVGNSSEEAAEIIQGWGKATGATNAEMRSMYATLGITGPAVESLAAAIGQEVAKHDEVTAAIKRQTEASWALYGAQLALVTGAIDQSAANQSYLAALDALNTTTDNATTLVNEHVVALNNAELASIRVMEQAKSTAEAQAALNGTTLDAKAAIDVQVAALENLAAGLAPGSELRVFLEQTVKSLQSSALSGRQLADALGAFYRSGGKRP